MKNRKHGRKTPFSRVKCWKAYVHANFIMLFPYVKNTVNFSKFKGKVYSIGIDFPPYHDMVKSKLEAAKKEVQPEWNEVDLYYLINGTYKIPNPNNGIDDSE